MSPDKIFMFLINSPPPSRGNAKTQKLIAKHCLRADVSYFPFPRATKEIGDVCTQAKQNIANALKKGKGRRQKVNTLGLN